MSSWGQPRAPREARPAECCPDRPHFGKGLCQACYAQRWAAAQTLAGRLEAARAGVRHAAECQAHFQRCAELATSAVERAHAIDLAEEWAKVAADAATDAIELERRIARGEAEVTEERIDQ